MWRDGGTSVGSRDQCCGPERVSLAPGDFVLPLNGPIWTCKTRQELKLWCGFESLPSLHWHFIIFSVSLLLAALSPFYWNGWKNPQFLFCIIIKAREMRLRVKSLRGALQRVPNNEQTVPASPKNPCLNSSMTERALIPKGHRFLNMMSLRCG